MRTPLETTRRHVLVLSAAAGLAGCGLVPNVNKPLTLYATTMHMHQLGQSAFLKVHRADGGTECVVDIPRWDFHWQLSYTLAKPVVINPGDQLEVSCTWDNTQANQPLIDGMQAMAVDRNWGARTQDEMCVGGIYVTEEK